MGGPGRKPETSDDELLHAIYDHDDPVVTANEIADVVGMTRQGVGARFKKLVDGGYVQRKKVGSRAAVYWLSGDGYDRVLSGGPN